MRKLGKKLVAVAGVIAMLMVILVYGFAETRIPGIVYLAMWCVCAADNLLWHRHTACHLR